MIDMRKLMIKKGDIMSGIRTKPFMLGLPTLETFASLCVAIAFVVYIYPTIFAFLVALFSSWLYGRYALNEYVIRLQCDIGGPIKQEIRVKGIPLGIFREIDELISNNKKIVVNFPQKHHLLRLGIKDYVYNRLGFVEFHDGDELSVTGTDLEKKAFILSYRSKNVLQEAISTLMNRGWLIDGSQGMESSFIDRVYTQTMVYDPEAA